MQHITPHESVWELRPAHDGRGTRPDNNRLNSSVWRDGNSEESRVKGLTMAYRNLKPGKDTVATPDDINGSTYLETHAWWHAVADDCAAHGQKFTIKPFKK